MLLLCKLPALFTFLVPYSLVNFICNVELIIWKLHYHCFGPTVVCNTKFSLTMSLFSQDIDSVQVPRLLFTTVEMLIIASLLIIITFRETVDLVAGEILADIETLHTRMHEVDQVAGHWVELLMDLATVIDMEEGKAFMVETIPMCALGREIGCVLMHYVVI